MREKFDDIGADEATIFKSRDDKPNQQQLIGNMS